MKSYLSLIPISAGVRRKQSNMIFLCIVLGVFLVTAIFSFAETGGKMETRNAVDKAGNWHIFLNNIQEGDAEQIAARPDVAASSWYDVINLDDHLNMDKDYYINGAQTALCGIEESFISRMMHYFSDEARIEKENEIILTENAKDLLHVGIGDKIVLTTPAGDYEFVISGFRISGNGKYASSNGGVTSALLVNEEQVGAFMNIHTFRQIAQANGEVCSPEYYIQFDKHTNLKKAISSIKADYGLEDRDVELNTILMASKGISNNSYIQNVYPLAVILFLLILAAGVMMISSSMNSNVAQRMQFFGMLRCIGASKTQIIRYVRLEALNWCKTAVPAGLALGIVATWLISACMKYLVGGELEQMPVFIISVTGIGCGGAVGIITVLLAAQVPAKRAAKASPVTAVSGNTGNGKKIKHTANARLGKIETILGIHHAIWAKKNLFLMTGSFALSIILFLCFSVLIELVNCMLPQKASAPDIEIMTKDRTNSMDAALLDWIREIDGVAHAYGRRICFDVPAQIPDGLSWKARDIDLMSYDDYELGLLVKDKDLRKGSDIEKVYGDSRNVLVIWDRDMPLRIGDNIRIKGEELKIAGMLKYSPFSNDGSSGGKITIIVSEETFINLTGITEYAVIDTQMEGKSLDDSSKAAEQIRRLSKGYQFRDRREESVAGMFMAFMVVVYGFIGVIALIAMLNMMNSISMSVSARMNQYGAMRAVGMSMKQLTKMVAAECFTYAVFGCMAGFGIGLPLSKFMYDRLVTSHFYYSVWQVPVAQIIFVLLFVFAAAACSIYGPWKRIKNMAVTDAINEL